MGLTAALETTKDKNGADLRIGSVCVYIARPKDKSRAEYTGRKVIVRSIHCGDGSNGPIFGKPHLRVDDAIDKPDNLDFHWGAWVNGDELVAV